MLIRAMVWIGLTISLAGCGGSGGGAYGTKPTAAPIAVASVINTGAGPGRDATIKSGADVVLSGKDSDGTDSPAIRFTWQQVDSSGIKVELIERTNNSVVFTAPRVSQATLLKFRLTVADAEGDTATDEVSVKVEPISDANRFLTYLNSHPDEFVLVATLSRGTRTTSDVNIRITESVGVTYADRTANGVPNRTLILDDVPRTLSTAFLGGTNANWNSLTEAIDAYYSPRFVERIPEFDVDEINKRFESSGRDARIEPEDSGSATLFVDLNLVVDGGTCLNELAASVNCQDRVALYLLRRDGTRLPVQSTPTSYRVDVTELYARQPTQPGQTAAESAATAGAYFRAVDPNDRRTKLSDWLEVAGFTRGGVRIAESEIAHATYVNNYDLGFGRDMYIRTDTQTGAVYAYVNNYPTLEAALKRLNNFATVAMEYSPPDQNPTGEKFVKFFAFAPDDSGDSVRLGSFNFDGRGEKWTPGVCTACHGGRPTFLENGEYANFGDVNAGFLPFDLDAYLYTRASDSTQVDPDLNANEFDEATLSRYSRANQESEFRRLNQMVAMTFDDSMRFAAARELVHGFYGDTTPPFDSFPNATFDSQFVQAGWSSEPELYRKVFARYCRACHTNNDRDTFATSADLFKRADRVRELVFEEGAMPLARLTHDRFWVPFGGQGNAAAEALRAVLVNLGQDPHDTTPGVPVARISGAPEIAMNQDQIRLEGSDSPGAKAFRWRFMSQPVGSSTRLVGATTTSPAFRIDQPGTYAIELVVSNERGDSAPALVTIRADSAIPFQVTPAPGVHPTAVVAEGGVVPIGNAVVRFNDIDNPPAELTYTITGAPVSGTLTQTRTLSTTTFTQQDVDDGFVEYRHLGDENTSDELTFSLSDGDNQINGQRLQILVLPVNDSPTLIRNMPINVPEGGVANVGAAALAVADSDNTSDALIYRVLTSPTRGALSALTFTQADIDAGSISYQHFGGEETNDSFRFDVTDGVVSLGPLTFNVDITPVADSPTAINVGPLDDAIRGRDTTITVNHLRFADADTADAGLTYTVTQAPTAGVLSNGTIALSTFSQQDIDDGHVLYRNQGDRNDLSAATADSFLFSVTDGTTLVANQQVSIRVNPAPDAPMRGLSDLMLQAFGLAEASTLTSSDLHYTTTSGAAVTYAVVSAPASGQLLVNGAPANSFTQADVDLGRVSYLPNNLAVTSDTFAFRAMAEVAPGVTLTVPAPSLAPEVFNISVVASFSRDVARVFRVRYDETRRICMECHCPSGSPACSIVPTNLAEAVQPAMMPQWDADPTMANGLLQQILLETDAANLENSPVLRRPQGLDLHPGGERPGFDVDSDRGGDRSRYDILLRWMQEGCRGPDDVVTGCLP